jgi:hypothetical protein
MTVYVGQQAARNLAANRAAILPIPNSENTVGRTPYEGFFARRATNRTMNNVRPTIGPSIASKVSNERRAEDLSKHLANPTSLRREMDERIKNLEKGNDYQWALKKQVSGGCWATS